MKEIITLKRSITEETEQLLNQQIHMEGESSAAYLSMASWCDTNGFANAARFLYNHSERPHQSEMCYLWLPGVT